MVSLSFVLQGTATAWAQEVLAGKVVGVSDGDTITLLTPEKRQVKIRLDGVDAPETRQPYGAKAKQFTSAFAFGKEARARVKELDRYGRTVADITVADQSLNKALVREGLAWWYRKYAPADLSLKQLEFEARQAKRNLWSDKAPIAPWEWRKGKTASSNKTASPPRATGIAASGSRAEKRAPSTSIGRTIYITNTGTKYHETGCRHLRRSQIAISLKDAEAQGYAPCKHCH